MKITAQIKAPIREEMELFEQKFQGAMSSKVALLNRITYYIVNRKGKQMRPMFVFLVAKMVSGGGMSERTYRGASVIELIHTATVVHDDVVDDSNNNVFAFSRKDRKGKEVLVISNFSNQVLEHYEIGVDTWGSYKIVLNRDAKKYDGIAINNRNLKTINKEKNEFKYTLGVNIPPYTTMYIEKK